MSKFKEITPEKHRCTIGACPAIYRSEDGKTLTIIGSALHPLPEGFQGKISITETAIQISADLVLDSLGVGELVEAAKPIVRAYDEPNCRRMSGVHDVVVLPASYVTDLLSALENIQKPAKSCENSEATEKTHKNTQ